jgi:hypothetical protein
MKKIILSMALLLCVGSMLGQTAEKLIEKWKAMPGVQYENTEMTGDSIEMASDEEMATKGLSEEEIAFIRKNYKGTEQVTMEVDSILMETLNKDILSLKGYELLMVLNENNAPDEEGNIFQQLMSQVMNPQSKLSVYGKEKKNVVEDVLVRWDIWNKVVLAHLNCKIKKESLEKVFSDDVVKFDRDEDDAVDMKEMVKEVEAGNVLIVINGQEYPNLRSAKEADEWMRAQGISWNHETWVVGGSVKEKYPNTDKKVVIEFTREEK